LQQEGWSLSIFDYLADNYLFVYPSRAGIGEGGKIGNDKKAMGF